MLKAVEKSRQLEPYKLLSPAVLKAPKKETETPKTEFEILDLMKQSCTTGKQVRLCNTYWFRLKQHYFKFSSKNMKECNNFNQEIILQIAECKRCCSQNLSNWDTIVKCTLTATEIITRNQ